MRPFYDEIYEIYKSRGTKFTRGYIYNKYKIKIKGKDLRQFLGVADDNRITYSQQVHKLAWEYAGWNGKKPDASVIGIKTKLLQAGLLRSGEKMNIL